MPALRLVTQPAGDGAAAVAGRVSDAGLLWLMQLADGAFPNGGFADSRGLEALWRARGLDAGELQEVVVAACRHAVARGDAWFAAAAWEATRAGVAQRLRAVAERDLASRPSALQRAASRRKGAATLRVARAVLEGAQRRQLAWAAQALDGQEPYATALGSAAAAGGASRRDVRLGIVHAEAAGMAGALVKLGLLTPTEAQAAIRRGTRAALVADEGAGEPAGWSSFAPLLEIAAMRHETLAERLFES